MQNFISINFIYTRKINFLSRKDLCEIFGCSYGALSSYEQGVSLPPIDLIQHICKNYNINIDDFVNKDLSKFPKQDDVITVKEPEATYKLDDTIKVYLNGYEKSLMAMQKTIDVKDDVIAAKNEQIEVLKKNYNMLEVLFNQNRK